MKVRNGFVSNSSSSSFIIESYDLYKKNMTGKYTPEEIFEQVKKMIKKYCDNGIKNARKEAEKLCEQYKKWGYGNSNIDECEENIIRRYERLSEENVEKYIEVQYVKDANQDNWLAYWYAGKDLDNDNIVIMDNVDNFISEKLAKKIIKKYNVDKERFCLHMG